MSSKKKGSFVSLLLMRRPVKWQQFGSPGSLSARLEALRKLLTKEARSSSYCFPPCFLPKANLLFFNILLFACAIC